ncbi:MAG: YoaK family protein [Steroidobacteraceae bacterium]
MVWRLLSRRELAYAGVLSGVGGWVDAVTYLRFGAFSGAMSGNTVLLGLSLARGAWPDVLYYTVLVAAFLGAIVATRYGLAHGWPQAVLLIGSAVALAASDFIIDRWGVLLTAGALGAQNAAMRRFAGVTLNSVFITGNLEVMGEAVSRLRRGGIERKRVVLIATAWFCYALGAACGAAAHHFIRHLVLALPAIAVVGTALTLLGPQGGRRRRLRHGQHQNG